MSKHEDPTPEVAAKMTELYHRMNAMYKEIGLEGPTFTGTVLGYLQWFHENVGPDAVIVLIGTLEHTIANLKKDSHH